MKTQTLEMRWNEIIDYFSPVGVTRVYPREVFTFGDFLAILAMLHLSVVPLPGFHHHVTNRPLDLRSEFYLDRTKLSFRLLY